MSRAGNLFLICLMLALSFGKPTKLKENDFKVTPDNRMTTKPQSSMENRDKMDDAIDIIEIMNECNNSFHIEMSYLESLNESGSFPDETDKTPKCYIRCLLEKTGVVSLDSQFDAERAAVVFAGERGGKTMDLSDMAAECSNREETCKCERAYGFLKCLMEMEIEKYEQSNTK